MPWVFARRGHDGRAATGDDLKAYVARVSLKYLLVDPKFVSFDVEMIEHFQSDECHELENLVPIYADHAQSRVWGPESAHSQAQAPGHGTT